MEFGNVNLIRLGDGSADSPKLYVEHDLEYKGNEYICVRMLNKAENMPYGNHFFMQVVKGLDGQRGCRLVDETETGDVLRRITGSALHITKAFGQKVPGVAVMYSFSRDQSRETRIEENRYTYLRRRADGRIGCDCLGGSVQKYADWTGTDSWDPVRAGLEKNRQKVSVLYELAHDGQRYLYLRDAGKTEDWFFIKAGENSRQTYPDRVNDESLANMLWSRIISNASAPESPQRH